MYRLKIAGTDQVSFGPVPVLMVVKIIWSIEIAGHACLKDAFTYICSKYKNFMSWLMGMGSHIRP